MLRWLTVAIRDAVLAGFREALQQVRQPDPEAQERGEPPAALLGEDAPAEAQGNGHRPRGRIK
jgi:hypothetical protein